MSPDSCGMDNQTVLKESFLHLAPDAGVIELKISKIGPDFSFRFLLMSRMTERVTKMIMTPRANLGIHTLDDSVDETVENGDQGGYDFKGLT